ncbi:hypothetical protein RB653_009340 [Dictyostelium firmibasis]|uniref:Uncharacterized protein n=1 Tax=Dictyostelium firmibasis TaxID=79012 RepID=A0AAN7U1R5_9MYCE
MGINFSCLPDYSGQTDAQENSKPNKPIAFIDATEQVSRPKVSALDKFDFDEDIKPKQQTTPTKTDKFTEQPFPTSTTTTTTNTIKTVPPIVKSATKSQSSNIDNDDDDNDDNDDNNNNNNDDNKNKVTDLSNVPLSAPAKSAMTLGGLKKTLPLKPTLTEEQIKELQQKNKTIIEKQSQQPSQQYISPEKKPSFETPNHSSNFKFTNNEDTINNTSFTQPEGDWDNDDDITFDDDDIKPVQKEEEEGGEGEEEKEKVREVFIPTPKKSTIIWNDDDDGFGE